jgi:hypothetical protein
MLVVALCVIGQRANAQHSELESRLPVSLRGAVVALADSVANVGLPRAPIIDKALEGVSKGADDRKILAAIRVVADNLGVARQALGAKAAPGEMTAGAAALRAGVSVNTLAQIRKTLPGRTLTVPLSVLSALVVQGVAAPTAAEVVVAQAKRDDDGRLLVLGQDAVRRLAAGVPAQVVVATFSTFGANVGDNRNIGGVPTPSQKSLIRKVKP